MGDVFKDFKRFGLVSGSETENIRDKMYVVKSKKQVNINHLNDKESCNVYGSCFTDEGLLFLTDYNNKALKLVDMSSEIIIDCLQIDACPLSICQISKNEFAVSLNNQCIQFVSKGDNLTTTKQLKLNHYCNGLAYKDNKLFISDRSTSLYIYDMNGTMLHKVTTDKQGNSIFSNNKHISVSSDGEMIYVADYYKGLIVLDLEGNYKTTIVDPDFVSPVGVCTDRRGNIFVSGWGQSKIVQICEKSGEKFVVLDRVQSSWSTCFSPEQNKLVVTKNISDEIEVYDLV